MNNAQLIHADSSNVEYYTPAEITIAARETMGGITLDPASCEQANRTVQASRFFTKDDNGLAQVWSGKVFLNWPFSRVGNKLWVGKLVNQYEIGNLEAAICICYASTSEEWFQPLLKHPQCYLRGRTHYILPDGSVKHGCTKGSVVTYFGKNVSSFAYHFRKLGTTKIAL